MVLRISFTRGPRSMPWWSALAVNRVISDSPYTLSATIFHGLPCALACATRRPVPTTAKHAAARWDAVLNRSSVTWMLPSLLRGTDSIDIPSARPVRVSSRRGGRERLTRILANRSGRGLVRPGHRDRLDDRKQVQSGVRAGRVRERALLDGLILRCEPDLVLVQMLRPRADGEDLDVRVGAFAHPVQLPACRAAAGARAAHLLHREEPLADVLRRYNVLDHHLHLSL